VKAIEHDLSEVKKKQLSNVVNLISHSIDVGPAKHVKQSHYPVSPAIELGVIEESDSSWSSPLVIVQKRGKFRLCTLDQKVHFLAKNLLFLSWAS